VHKFGNFFGLRSVAHETFSARVQFFCKLVKLQIFVHKFGNFFLCARCRARKIFRSRATFCKFAKFSFSCASFSNFSFLVLQTCRIRNIVPLTCKQNWQARIEPLIYQW
jgi:hypothetical protein